MLRTGPSLSLVVLVHMSTGCATAPPTPAALSWVSLVCGHAVTTSGWVAPRFAVRTFPDRWGDSVIKSAWFADGHAGSGCADVPRHLELHTEGRRSALASLASAGGLVWHEVGRPWYERAVTAGVTPEPVEVDDAPLPKGAPIGIAECGLTLRTDIDLTCAAAWEDGRPIVSCSGRLPATEIVIRDEPKRARLAVRCGVDPRDDSLERSHEAVLVTLGDRARVEVEGTDADRWTTVTDVVSGQKRVSRGMRDHGRWLTMTVDEAWRDVRALRAELPVVRWR